MWICHTERYERIKTVLFFGAKLPIFEISKVKFIYVGNINKFDISEINWDFYYISLLRTHFHVMIINTKCMIVFYKQS